MINGLTLLYILGLTFLSYKTIYSFMEKTCKDCNKIDIDCICVVSCQMCGLDMPKLRLETHKVCIKCADEQPYSGFMVYGHKTAGNIQLIKSKDKEALRRADRANRRAR